MLNKIKETIDKYKNIIISAHVNPDGDAFGALFTLKYIIEEYAPDKNVDIVIQYELPKYIYKFPESSCIKNSYNEKEVELVIMVDTASMERAAIDNNIFKIAKETINIDHHISNTKYLNINYVEDISSTSELLYKFLELFNVKLSEKIAKFMYLGIINDTGNFRHGNVTKNTFEVSAKLMEVGINNNEISSILFSKSKGKAKAFGLALFDHTFIKELGFAYYFICKEKMKEYNLTDEDVDGISELLISIDGVKVSLFIREDEKSNLKGSLRSKKIDVNNIAGALGGGGHKLASGFRTNLCFDEVMDIIIKKLEGEENA